MARLNSPLRGGGGRTITAVRGRGGGEGWQPQPSRAGQQEEWLDNVRQSLESDGDGYDARGSRPEVQRRTRVSFFSRE